jgi:hypothetical protein
MEDRDIEIEIQKPLNDKGAEIDKRMNRSGTIVKLMSSR